VAIDEFDGAIILNGNTDGAGFSESCHGNAFCAGFPRPCCCSAGILHGISQLQ
jgi:hypothetical protein